MKPNGQAPDGRLKTVVRYPFVLISVVLATTWLYSLGVRVHVNISIPRELRAKQVTSMLAKTTCKPPLPSLLLQRYPPSADTWVLRPLLAALGNVAAGYAALDTVDSISIGVVGPQGLMWSKGFGRAKANGTEAAPPDKHTIYRIASISKLFTTMEGFVLQDKGYVNWDDPVSKHIHSFTYNPQGWKEYITNNRQAPGNDTNAGLDPVTLRQLASHTSGIGRDWPYYNIEEWPSIPPNLPLRQWPTLEEELLSISETPSISPPSSFPVYSNTGLSILGAALVAANSAQEKKSLTYAELLQRDLFTPLGMNGSSFAATAENVARLAIPKNGIEVDFDPDESFHAPGGQFSSLSDLASTVRFLLNLGSTSAKLLLHPSTIREWVRPSYPQPDTATETGLVWEILKLQDSHGRVQRFYSKAGDLATFHSELIFNPQLQLGVVVLNTGTNPIAPSLSRVALKLLMPGFETILEKRVKERYAGVWKGKGDDEMAVVVEEGLLSITKWRVNGFDFLKLYEGGILDRVSLWSTGRLDEFRIGVGIASINVDPLYGCFPYWVTMDALSSRHTPIDLLYFEGEGNQRAMRFPSANATLYR